MLLLDEPFGSLDAKVRQELRRWLRRLHDEIHITSIFVTHDQEEALEVADRVVVMNEGRIEQVGTPAEVYHHPATPFVCNVLGNVNLFHSRIEGGKAYIGNVAMELPENAQPDAQDAVVYVRPHQLDIHHQLQGQDHFRARVKHINAAGPPVKIELITEWSDTVRVEISQERFSMLHLEKDLEVFVCPKELCVFPDDASGS
jgi:sulfate transport system ATP-binding protein